MKKLLKKALTPSALLCMAAFPLCGCNCETGRAMSSPANDDTDIAFSSPPPRQGCETSLAMHDDRSSSVATYSTPAPAPASDAIATADFPASALPGECYGKVYVPPQTQTVEERVMVREASERHEIVPARYEWVEEQVLVKEACTQMVEEPAQYKTEDRTVEVRPAQTTWVMDSTGRCRTENGQPTKDVFCLVNRPAVTKTVTAKTLAKPCTCKTVQFPAEYQTVKRQKLVEAATTKKIVEPAEYETVERTIVAAPARWEWQRVICDIENSPTTLNDVKRALIAAGYQPGPFNGELNAEDWAAIRAYQEARGLGVGELSYQTLDSLQVSAK